jgi:membrane protease YdiL (CAAX protease family)
MSAFVRRNQLAVFVALAYLLSWWPWVWYQLDPGNVDAPILPIGPLLATLIVLPIIGGWVAVKELFSKITHWRVGWRWFAFSILLPVCLTLGAVAIHYLWGAQRSATFVGPGIGEIAVRFVFIFLWIALGEEPGWRGFALPRLLNRHTALTAALVLGLIHMVWHAPLYGVEYDASNVLPWGISVFCFSIVICWVYLHTGGSILMAMLMHASNNTIAPIRRMFEDSGELRFWWIWCALWVATALIVVLATGRDLGRKQTERVS